MRSLFCLNGLWRHADFRKLWFGQTVSLFGSQITLLALPLTAAISLNATPTQIGILGAAQGLPLLLLGLFVGVWVDRYRRRPILIAADLTRAIMLLVVPFALVFSVLSIELLYVVAFLEGISTVFFDITYQSFLPCLVETPQIIEGNSKLEVSRSAAQVIGPSVAGVLLQFLAAPLALLLDALSFLASGVFLLFIRRPEPTPPSVAQRRNIWQEIGEGLSVLKNSPLLRTLTAFSASWNLYWSMIFTLFVLYASRELNLDAGLIGLTFAAGGVGYLCGALLSERAARRYGPGPTIVGAGLLGASGGPFILLASGTPLMLVLLLGLGQFLISFGEGIFNVNALSLRQALTPQHLLGRVSGTTRFINWGTIPLGSLLAGIIGANLGLRLALLIGVGGLFMAVFFIFFSSVKKMKQKPIVAVGSV